MDSREGEYSTQLRMIWPEHLLDAPPLQLPPGYSLRPYRPGDEPRFFKIMELAGWPGWNEETLRPWRERILTGGWFMAVQERSDEIVATGMAFRDRCEFGRQGGEIGWIACVLSTGARGWAWPSRLPPQRGSSRKATATSISIPRIGGWQH